MGPVGVLSPGCLGVYSSDGGLQLVGADRCSGQGLGDDGDALATAADAGLLAPLDPHRDATAIYNLWTTHLRDLRRAGKLGQLDEINAAADYLWKLCGRILRIPTHERSAGKGPR